MTIFGFFIYNFVVNQKNYREIKKRQRENSEEILMIYISC